MAESYIKDLRGKIEEEKQKTYASEKNKFALRLSGNLKNETAYRIDTPTEFTKIKNQLILSETGKISDDLRFKLTGRFYYDAVYDLTNNYPGNVASDQRADIELRDTYLDYSTGPWDLRVGKQQIVWGEAVGLFFADIVNAKDLREYVLPDFDMIRIPEWGTDLEYSKKNFHAEFVWIPFLEFNKLGVTNSEFAFPLPLPTASTQYSYVDPDKPKSSFNNSEVGGRLSYLFRGWDVSAFYLHTWDHFPVYYRQIDAAGAYNFSPERKRLDVAGATFAKEMKDVVLKGEFVFNKDGYFSIFDDNNVNGVVRKNFIDYLIGADYTFFGKIDTNIQFMQRVIFNHSNLLAENERQFRNTLSIWLKTGFFDGKCEPELLIIAGLMEPDFMYRPKVNFKVNDHWHLRIGADIFKGHSSGVFGRFNKKSRIYSEVSYNF